MFKPAFHSIFSIVLCLLIPLSTALAQTNTQTIALRDGFNFVSLTLKPVSTAADIRTQTPAVSEIYGYSASSGSFLSVGEGTLAALNYAKGYIIKSNGPATMTIAGTTPAIYGDIALKTGFNLLGFSKTPSSGATFSQLMVQSQLIEGIYKWSAASGSFIQVIRSGGQITQPDGFDPAVKQGESYFIKMTDGTTFNYDGAVILIGGTGPAALKVKNINIGDFVNTSKGLEYMIVNAAQGEPTHAFMQFTGPQTINGKSVYILSRYLRTYSGTVMTLNKLSSQEKYPADFSNGLASIESSEDMETLTPEIYYFSPFYPGLKPAYEENKDYTTVVGATSSKGKNFSMTIVDNFSSETITVPAGTFNCIKMRESQLTKSDNGPSEFWYAAGVGIVRMIEYDLAGKATSNGHLELSSIK